MKTYNNLLYSLLIFLSFCLCISCSSSENSKFSKSLWNKRDDTAFPPPGRENSLDDLLSTHKFVGLHYKELIGLLGLPDQNDSNSLYYEISVDYGNDIDPIGGKNLIFFFSQDSLITKYKIDEWPK